MLPWILCALLLLLVVAQYYISMTHRRVVNRGFNLLASQEFNNRMVPIGQPQVDKVVYLFNTLIDKLREERLKNLEQESFLDKLIEVSPMGIAMLDYDGHISLMNPAFIRMTELTDPSSLMGKSVEHLPDEWARIITSIPEDSKKVVRQSNTLLFRIWNLHLIQRGFKRRFFLVEPLTEEVMKAEKNAYEKLIRTIAHEVNNTLGGVRSVFETLVETSESQEITDVLESCDRRCDKLSSFISSYVDLVKMPEPVLNNLELNASVRSLLPFLQRLCPPQTRLTFSPSGKCLLFQADMAMLEQVLINIVKNASEAIGDSPGEVVISTSAGGKKVNLTVANNGQPIPPEVAQQIFSPFFTTKPGGMGMGLMLISEILKKHKATFSLATGPDNITRFSISFPAHSE